MWTRDVDDLSELNNLVTQQNSLFWWLPDDEKPDFTYQIDVDGKTIGTDFPAEAMQELTQSPAELTQSPTQVKEFVEQKMLASVQGSGDSGDTPTDGEPDGPVSAGENAGDADNTPQPPADDDDTWVDKIKDGADKIKDGVKEIVDEVEDGVKHVAHEVEDGVKHVAHEVKDLWNHLFKDAPVTHDSASEQVPGSSGEVALDEVTLDELLSDSARDIGSAPGFEFDVLSPSDLDPLDLDNGGLPILA